MMKIKALLLPKFELAPLTGDTPGEAQAFYREYFKGCESFEIPGSCPGSRLYVNADGVSMYITGMGKVNAASSVTALLCDSRFDFSSAYILSVGCAGGAEGYAVMGDVFVITAAVDFDMGHHADIREMENSQSPITWFHDVSYDDVALTKLNPRLTEKVYALLKDLPLQTTPRTQAFLKREFPCEAWAVQQPCVKKGTTVSGDNFWKGKYDHANAAFMCTSYGCSDPFALSEMEDSAIGAVLRRFGMADRYIIIRTCVNMDVFMNGDTPEKLWNPNYRSTMIASDDNIESADIFPTAMENNFRAVRLVVSAIVNGELP